MKKNLIRRGSTEFFDSSKMVNTRILLLNENNNQGWQLPMGNWYFYQGGGKNLVKTGKNRFLPGFFIHYFSQVKISKKSGFLPGNMEKILKIINKNKIITKKNNYHFY